MAHVSLTWGSFKVFPAAGRLDAPMVVKEWTKGLTPPSPLEKGRDVRVGPPKLKILPHFLT